MSIILYHVNNGVITQEEVVRETTCGWRQKPWNKFGRGGFINRFRPGKINKYSLGNKIYHTTSINEARQWSAEMIHVMTNLIYEAADSQKEDRGE